MGDGTGTERVREVSESESETPWNVSFKLSFNRRPSGLGASVPESVKYYAYARHNFLSLLTLPNLTTFPLPNKSFKVSFFLK